MFDDAGAAVELGARDRVNAPDQFAQDQECWRSDHEADEGHQRVLHHHYDGQADQRQQVAANRSDQQIDDLCRCAAPVDRRRQILWNAGRRKAQAFTEQLAENRTLIVGNDAVADTREHHAVAICSKTLESEQYDGDDADRDDPANYGSHRPD